MTKDELLKKLQHDIELGYIEETEPGKYRATRLGETQSRLEACVSLLMTMTTAAQRIVLLLNEDAPAPWTVDELLERENGGQPLAQGTGQYL